MNRRRLARSRLLRVIIHAWLLLCAIGGSASGILTEAVVGPVAHSIASACRAADEVPLSLRRVNVPAARPDLWPAGPWEAMPREDFEKALRRTGPERAEPPVAWMETSTFAATLIDDTLRLGRWHARLRAPEATPTLLPLSPLNFALHDLAWDDREAIWGADAEGRAWLRIDSDASELIGEFSLAGRGYRRHVEFDWESPAALRTSIELQTPPGSVVESSAGEVRRLETGADFARWRIELGVESKARISIQRDPAAPSPPRVVYEAESVVMIREDELRGQWVVPWESLDGATSKLSFSAPSGSSIYGVMIGNDGPIPWTNTREEAGRLLFDVPLPQPVRGRGRPLRIDLGVVVRGQPTAIPALLVSGGVFLGGRQELRVLSPLQVRSFRGQGYRQISPIDRNPEGESLRIQLNQSNPHLLIEARRPPAQLTGRIACLIQAQESPWDAVADVAWSASSGSVFSASCRIAAGWSVVEVAEPNGDSSRSRLANWDVQPQAGGGSLLTVEFLEAISAADARRVVITFRRASQAVAPADAEIRSTPLVDAAADAKATTAESPKDAEAGREAPPSKQEDRIVAPLSLVNAEAVSIVLAVDGPDVRVGEDSDWEAIPAQRLPDWVRSASWVNRRPAGERRFFQGVQQESGEKSLLLVEPKSAEPSELTSDNPQASAAPDRPAVVDVLRFQASWSTVLGRPETRRDSHVFRFHALGGLVDRETAVELPSSVQLEGVRVDGVFLPTPAAGAPLVVPRQSSGGWRVLELRYFTPAEGSAWWSRRRLAAPTIAGQIVTCEFSLATPRDVCRFSDPPNVHWYVPPQRIGWTERLFGVLGRSRPNSWFAPWRLTHWADLWWGVSTSNDRVESSVDGPASSLLETEYDAGAAVLESGELAQPELGVELVLWDRSQWASVWWIALIGSLWMGVLLRVAQWSRRELIGSAWILANILTSAIGAAPWAQLCGSATVGAMIAALLPRQACRAWNPAAPVVPDGSTRSFPVVRTLVGLWLLAAVAPWSPPLRSISPISWLPVELTSAVASGQLLADDAARGEETLLTPVDADGNLSQSLPLVYVSPRLKQRLLAVLENEESAAPRCLLARAEYALRSDGASLGLAGRWDAWNLGGSGMESILVRLPIGSSILSGDRPCSIDGEPRPVLPAGPGFVQIELPPTSEPVRHAIELRLRHSPPPGGKLTWPLPPVPQSRLVLEDRSVDVVPTVHGQIGDVLKDAGATGRTTTAWLGPVQQVSIDWLPAAARAEVKRCDVTLLQAVDLHTERAIVRLRAHVTPSPAGLFGLCFDIPAEASPRSVAAPHLLRSWTANENGRRQLHLEFDRPWREPGVLDAELLIPSPTQPLKLSPVSAVSTDAVQVRTLQSWRSVTGPADARLVVHSPAVETLSAVISVEEFHRAWGESPPVATPQVIHDLRETDELVASLGPVPPRRRATGWRHLWTVQSQSLEWQLTGDVETSQTPVYSHSLIIDRRLRVAAASIQEQGAERLLRFHTTRMNDRQSRVTLFLTDRTAGRQTITLRGGAPWKASDPQPLPLVRLEDAESLDVQATVMTTTGMAAEATLERGATPLPLPADAPNLVARFLLQDDQARAILKTRAVDATVSARLLSVWRPPTDADSPQHASMWRVAVGAAFRSSSLTTKDRTLVLPPAFTAGLPPDAPFAVSVGKGGSAELRIPCANDASPEGLTFDTSVSAAETGFELPLLRSPDAADVEQWCLLVDPDRRWRFPAEWKTAAWAEMPDWVLAAIPDEQPANVLAVLVRSDRKPPRLERLITPAAPASMPFMATRHLISPHGELHATTQLFVRSSRAECELRPPRNARLTGVFVDGVWKSSLRSSPSLWSIPLRRTDALQCVTLIWTSSLHARIGGYGSYVLPWPEPIDARLDECRVWADWLGRRDDAFSRSGGFLPSEFVSLDLMRNFATIAEQSTAADESRDWGRLGVRALGRSLFSSESALFAAKEWASLDPSRRGDLREQWTRMEGQSVEPVPMEASPLLRGSIGLPAWTTSPGAGSVVVWRFPTPVLYGAGAGLAAFFIWPLLRRLLRWNASDWLSRHPTTAWCLLGMLWWCCLQPSVLGWLVLTVALVRRALRPSRIAASA